MERLRELEKDQELSGSLDPQGIPLIPSTPEEMDDMLKLCSFVRFKIPQQVVIDTFQLGRDSIRSHFVGRLDFFKACVFRVRGE